MKITVVIVVYNHKEYLKNCLDFLLRAVDGLSYEIFLIDNHSNDGSANFLKKREGERIKVILNKKNLGFARACNQGIRKAKGEYLLLLNPDVELEKESVKLMINFLEKRKNPVVAVPLLFNPDGSVQYSIRKFPGFFSALIRRTPLRLFPFLPRDFHFVKKINQKKPTQIDWALGGCFLAKREVFEKIGLLDEKFFVYCEDIDWFYRLRKERIKAYCFPEAKATHYHLAKSDKKIFSKESFYHFRSMVYFFKKYWREIFSFRYPPKKL